MRKINALMIYCFLIVASTMHLSAAPLLNFDDFSFENAKETGSLWSLQGQVVQVRGFWYPLSGEEGILTPHPQLKSCCLRAPNKIEQQVLIKGAALAMLSPQKVLSLEGTFHIQPAYNAKGELIQLFVLERAQEVYRPQGAMVGGILLIAFLIMLMFWCFKLKRSFEV